MGRGTKITPRQHSEICRRLDAGHDIDDIAEALGYSRRTVFQIERFHNRDKDNAANKKSCAACGRTFHRPRGLTKTRWNARKTCSLQCGVAVRDGRHTLIAEREIDEDYVLTDRQASHELLRRLVRYGLNNDGLPGLAANDLIALAKKLKVAA
jgi:hypothetical protein